MKALLEYDAFKWVKKEARTPPKYLRMFAQKVAIFNSSPVFPLVYNDVWCM